MNKYTNNITIITMRKKRGMHTDIYEDFESDIIKHTNWKSVKGSINIVERIFEKYFLPRIKCRTFHFDLHGLNPERVLFSSLSGIEYIKIFQHYLFKAKLKIIYQFDSWTHDNVINENAIRSFKINIAFITIKKSAEYFNSLNIPGFKAYWMPEAINIDKYRWRDYKMKSIDILQYGRRWEWLHEQIMTLSKAENINYQYPKESDNVKRQFESRAALIDGLSKSKVVICVPKTITHPDTYDLPTITARYFECMSSKCLILGRAPQDLITLFGYNPVVEVDNINPQKQLKYLLANYHDFTHLIEKNYDNVRFNHQWQNRITEIQQIITRALQEKT